MSRGRTSNHDAVGSFPHDEGLPLSVEAARLFTAVLDNVLVAVIRGKPTVDTVNSLRDRAAGLAAAHREGIGLFHVVELGQGPPPDHATRTAYVDFLRERTELRVTAVIGEAPPFLGALVRSVATTFMMLARPRYPFRLFGRLDEGKTWFCETTKLGESDLGAVLEGLRQAL
jgi:hypothetical protein